MFSEEKCELLKVNSKVGDATIQVNGKSVKTVRVVRYLGDPPLPHRFLVHTCSSIQTGREQCPLPSCAYTTIQEKFMSDDEDFVLLKNRHFWNFSLIYFKLHFTL